jgi:O-antigen/teichoic acid export membrane protein
MRPDPSPDRASETKGTTTGAAAVVGRSFSFRLGSQVISALINVTGMVILGNYLAAQGYGEYAFYYALVPLLATLSDLGVGVIITREVARDKARGALYLGDAILIKGITGAAMLVLVMVTAPFVFDPTRALLICLVTATAIVDLSQDVGMWTFRAHDRQDLEAVLLLVSQVVWLGGILLCSALHAPLPFILGSATIAFAIRLAVGALVVTRRMYRPVFAPDWQRIKHLIGEGLPFGMAMFTVVFYGRVGVLLLKGLSTNADVGFFNVGYMLSQPLGFVSSAFNISAFPTLARAAQRGASAIRPTLQRAVKFQFLIAMPLTVGLFMLSERVIPLLFHGGGFLQSARALKVISLGLTLIFLNLMSRYVLAALNEQRAYLRAIAIGLVVNVAVGAALIRSLGFMGACLGLLAGELAVLIVCQRTLSRYLPLGDLLRESVKPAAAALAMGLVVFVLRGANVFVLPVVGAIAYAVMLLLLKGFSTEELQMVRRVYVSFRLPASRPGRVAGSRP